MTSGGQVDGGVRIRDGKAVLLSEMARDGKDVVAGLRVESRELFGQECPVGVGGVGVEVTL
jgi:hypothetical protein